MADTDSIIQAAAERAESGEKSIQIGDKRKDFYTPKEMLEAAELSSALSSINTNGNGPFLRIGFRGRPV